MGGGDGIGVVDAGATWRARLLGLGPGPWRSPLPLLLGYRAVAVGVGLGDDLLDALEGHVRIVLRGASKISSAVSSPSPSASIFSNSAAGRGLPMNLKKQAKPRCAGP